MHSFSIEVAEKYGVDIAIITRNFYHWIEKNKANQKHCHDGSYWTYNSVRAFRELFKYWTDRQIARILTKMKEKGIIKTGNYNKYAYDRTAWYAFTDEFLDEMGWDLKAPTKKVKCILPNGKMDLPKKGNGLPEKVEPIPNINTDNNTNTIPPSAGDKKKPPSPVTLIHTHFTENYKRLHEQGRVLNEKPIVNYAKTGALIKGLLASVTVDQLKTVLDNGMKDDWIMKGGYSLEIILSSTQVNRLLNAKPSKPRRTIGASSEIGGEIPF